ncbi:MAG: hypothetical protein HY902_15380 [Deltaproteobacteria bacterium]|nr:hypothetical protein [Deltaproteobacteria bacterium]
MPEGQWVYTAQYGWLWMPYAQAYTYVMPDAALAYMYVFYPLFGWRWVVAPWVLGFGRAPHWGVHGPGRFWHHGQPWVRAPLPFRPFRGPGWHLPHPKFQPFRGPPARGPALPHGPRPHPGGRR